MDEIGDISPKLQSRLLRVIQEREIIRLGNDTVIPIDVRVICATNRDLKKEVSRGISGRICCIVWMCLNSIFRPSENGSRTSFIWRTGWCGLNMSAQGAGWRQ